MSNFNQLEHWIKIQNTYPNGKKYSSIFKNTYRYLLKTFTFRLWLTTVQIWISSSEVTRRHVHNSNLYSLLEKELCERYSSHVRNITCSSHEQQEEGAPTLFTLDDALGWSMQIEANKIVKKHLCTYLQKWTHIQFTFKMVSNELVCYELD